MDTGRIGRRIAHWRERRGFTQADFGRHMGQTKRRVQELEGGRRQGDPRLSVLIRASEVLRVPLEQLLIDGPPDPPPATTPPVEIVGVIDSIYQRLPESAPLPTMEQMRNRLVYCCAAYQACHFTALGRDLPTLIMQAERAADLVGPEAMEAHALHSRVLQLTASLLHKYGASTAIAAGVVADRALAAAKAAGSPVAIGAASRQVARSLTHQQQPAAAAAFAVDAARRLSDDLTSGGPEGLSTLGMLYLVAATATSTVQRSTNVVERASGYIAQAAEAADRQGADLNADWTMFGPTNVRLHRVDVAARFEDGWSALEAAEEIDATAFDGMARERKAQHLITMARASLLTRRKNAAVESLLEAARIAPEEVIGRQATMDLVKDVLRAVPMPSEKLRELGRRCGLPA
ncbi:helix-turn-helix domain-containing protein [Streptomyces sp. NPDC054796]